MEDESSILISIAVLGGTGKEGKGLVYRWAKAGYSLYIGSRSQERAQTTAEEITTLLGEKVYVEGMNNQEAAERADIVVLAVPYSAHRETLESIKKVVQGKILIDVTVPLIPPTVTKVQMPPAGSAAQEAYQILGKGVEICTAFQNISHENLLNTESFDCDVLVTGTSKHARSETLKLVAAAGLTGWDSGPLENSVVIEGLTSVLIYINKQYQSTHAGIKVTGVTIP
jgi:NADPH-dependent F420 reductase